MRRALRAIEIDGTQALAFATGGGLDFAVLVDRSLDIGPLLVARRAVGWVGPSGFRHPAGHDPQADDGRGFNRLFSASWSPAVSSTSASPPTAIRLHGSLPFTPATLTASGVDGERRLSLFCEGEVRQPGFRLRRRIEAPIDGCSLADRRQRREPLVRRRSARRASTTSTSAVPALADGTIVRQGTRRRLGPLKVPDAALGSVSYPVGDGGAECTVVTPNVEIAFTLGRRNPASPAAVGRSLARQVRAERRALHQRAPRRRAERRGAAAGARCHAALCALGVPRRPIVKYLPCLLLLVGWAAGAHAQQAVRVAADLPAQLYRPAATPAPAVAIFHGCGGVGANNTRMAELLKSWGYVALVVDSFTSRGLKDVCGRNWPSQADAEKRALDIDAAGLWLNGQDYVKGSQLAFMGYSYGGGVGLLRALSARTDIRVPSGWRAAILVYPDCGLGEAIGRDVAARGCRR